MDQNKHRNLRIIQNNVTSIRPTDTRELIKNYLSKENIDLVILSEIWLKPEETYKFPGYNFLKEARPSGYGGVGFLIKNDISIKQFKLPSLNPVEAIAIETLNTIPKMLIISIYIPPQPVNNNDIKTPLKKLLDIIEQQNKPTIIAGDFNAHNRLWNPLHPNCPRGELIEHLLEGRDLVLLNDGASTLIKPPDTIPSAIDLTFVSPVIACKSDWTVLDLDFFSNHKIIKLEIESAANVSQSQSEYLNKNQAIEKINKIQPHMIHTVEDISPIFAEQINSSKYNLNKGKIKKVPKPWWTKEIEQLLNSKNKKLKEFYKNQTFENFTNFKKERAILKRKIRSEKRKCWKELINSINPDMTQKELWNTVKMIGGGRPSKNNIILLNDQHLATQFMNQNFPTIVNEINYTPLPTQNYIKINFKDIRQTIYSKKDHSTPGPDLLSFYILKRINLNLQIRITELLEEVLNSGNIPEEWRSIKIIPLLKTSKDPNQWNSYRPLAMMNVLLKLINCTVKQELSTFISKNNILPVNSFGFKKHTSAINCVNYLVSMVTHSKREGLVMVATFLDLSKAFDNVNVDKLLETLRNENIPNHLVNWVYHYLKNRKTILLLNDGTEITQITNSGLPQGCPLSPILFNLYTKVVHKIIQEDGTLIQFADDFTAVIQGFSIAVAANKMNTFLSKLNLEFKNLGFELNPQKSASIVFTNKYNPNIDIHLNNTSIPIEESHKFLGIIVDHKLNFKYQIEQMCIKAKQKVNILKMISRKRSGAHPEQMLKITKAIVRSLLDYGITIVAAAAKTNFEKLDTVYLSALRTSMRYLKSTPNHVVLFETGEMPLKLRAEILASKEVAKTIYFNNSPIISHLTELMQIDFLPRHISYIEKIASVNNFHYSQLAQNIVLKSPSTFQTKLKVKDSIKNLKKANVSIEIQKQMVAELIETSYANTYHIYTDGSLMDTIPGFGFYDPVERISFSYRLKTGFTIMNTEIAAIIKAIEYANNKNAKELTIFTDSKSACSLLNNSQQTDNYLIKKLINLVEDSCIDKVFIQWIPGHINLLGNDRADRAAKLGTTRTTIEQINFTLQDLINILKMETVTIWQDQYTQISSDKGKFHFEYAKNITLKPWFKHFNFETLDTIMLSRIRSGHMATKDRLAKWNLIPNDRCDDCSITEDLEHLLYDCPNYLSIRTQYQDLINRVPIQQILAKNSKSNYTAIVEYLKTINKNV